MNPLSLLRIEIVKRPIFNLLLVLLAALGGNLGWSIIILTLFVRLLLIKNSAAAANMGKGMSDMQPKMKEIQEKYADDPQRMSEEMMKLWKTPGSNPLKWCFTMLIQIPVFLGLFYTVKDIAEGRYNTEAYSFLSWLDVDLGNLITSFYGMDLLTPNNIVLTIIAAVLMFGQMQMMTMLKGKQATPKIPGLGGGENMPDMSKMMGMMNYFMVIMIGWFVWTMPAGVGLYITTTTAFGILQQVRQQRPMIKLKLGMVPKSSGPEIIEP
mgnify:CR=1 FL=1